jgi:hypothetical protein
VLRPGSSLGQDLHDIAQGLFGLGGEVVALEHLAGGPAHLPRDENLAALGGDAIGEALGLSPVLGVKVLHEIARSPGDVA